MKFGKPLPSLSLEIFHMWQVGIFDGRVLQGFYWFEKSVGLYILYRYQSDIKLIGNTEIHVTHSIWPHEFIELAGCHLLRE